VQALWVPGDVVPWPLHHGEEATMSAIRGLLVVGALWAIVAGVWVGLASPLMSGGHLIAGPVLILAGGGLLVRIRRSTGARP
jgi:hypothetical protein